MRVRDVARGIGTRVRTMRVEYLTRVGIGQMVVCGDRRICSNEISCRDRRIFYSASFFKVDMRRSQLGSLLDILA